MFESVAPETFEARSRRVLYETLPLSLALHAMAIAAAAVIAVWNVVFPVQSPRLVRAYSLATIPEPPPPPPLPPAGAPAPKQVAMPKPIPLPDKIVAPTVIPDIIPAIPDPPPPSALMLAPAPGPPAVGVPGGNADGKLGGDLAGSIHGVAGGVAFPDDGRVHISMNESLPLLPISQDYPAYPDEAKKKQLEDQVIVRYVIGKNGRVISVEIIDHAHEPMFDKATVEAIKQWRFRPMIKDGKPVEVVHDLAVNFQLIRH
ncbi:MAG TPA: energy transducer TonB [Thermoanaerobaculia bacterium]